jgi:hypothetical protein
MEKCKIIDSDLPLENRKVNLCWFAEVDRILDARIQVNAVNIRILARCSLDRVSAYIIECGKICLLLHKPWNALEISDIDSGRCRLVLAVLFDECIKEVLSPTYSNHLRALLDQSIGHSFPNAGSGSNHQDLLV